MALTPREERQIHQIEESLIETDPGFVARMTGLLRPRRGLVIAGVCLVGIAIGLGLAVRASVGVCLYCAAIALFSAGLCLGRAGELRLWTRPWHVVTSAGRVAASAARRIRHPRSGPRR